MDFEKTIYFLSMTLDNIYKNIIFYDNCPFKLRPHLKTVIDNSFLTAKTYVNVLLKLAKERDHDIAKHIKRSDVTKILDKFDNIENAINNSSQLPDVTMLDERIMKMAKDLNPLDNWLVTITQSVSASKQKRKI